MGLRRLDQILASLGYASRREVPSLIDRGLVRIDGQPAKRADQRVEASSVTYRGEPLEAPDGLLVLLHKPLGYVCSHSTNEGPSIYELLPDQWLMRNPSVTSIGRLDKESTGVLLITDQGKLVQRWTSPKATVSKVYEVTVDHELSPELIPIFAAGTLILNSETTPCLPAHLEITGPRSARLTITEGRYHQVRRMFASQGWHVESLHRSHFGDFTVGDVALGEWTWLPLPAL
jgi:16S rRNA pseudouridine516 synthase